MSNASRIARQLRGNTRPLAAEVVLDLGDFRIAVHSNSASLLDTLSGYFRHTLGSGPADVDVWAFEETGDDARARVGLPFIDWSREPGKTGRKDAYADLEDGRLILKVRTGMLFLQSEQHRIAVGPCEKYPNQVINFINAQYMNQLQRDGAVLCHAAGLTIDGHGVGLAGFSGGGKSTLMLRLLANATTTYVSNDRLLLLTQGSALIARGIPKLPRVNPGTVVNDPLLCPMLSRAEVDGYRALTQTQLWDLEHKYDVDVLARYGEGKITSQAPLALFIILNWERDADRAFQFEPVELRERPELLRAVMKSPGPFYQQADGEMWRDDQAIVPQPYIERLGRIAIFEACGGVDFVQAAAACMRAVRTLEHQR